MTDEQAMDTDPSPMNNSSFNVDRFRLANENDQQWFYRKQFIEAFRFDYTEERLLCLAQCYANTKCLGCKYSEPLKSLLTELSEKISTSTGKRPNNQESGLSDHKRSTTTINSTASISSMLTNTPNFVSFSSPTIPKSSNLPSASIATPSIDPKLLLSESAENKSVRLRTLANQLRQTIETTQNRTNNDENDHAIEHIYQVGTQQRLFVDYRPDNINDTAQPYGKSTSAFVTQTFYGKLYIDDVYICSGYGTNKKICKRTCFQQALNIFLSNDFEVKSMSTKDGRQQYELISKRTTTEPKLEKMEGDLETFGIPTTHPMANTKINFVHARDTSTIAGRTAQQQNQLERQYWQQYGINIAPLTRPNRTQRSFSPPPPVPHQQPMDSSATATIEALSTTPASVANVVAEIERAVNQQEKQRKIIERNSMPTAHMDIASYPAMETTKNPIDSQISAQQKVKLTKLQPLLFNLLNTQADGSHSIDLISTLINKYQLNADFECADKPTSNGFHGHLIIEQIEIADGFGINKKLAKKQTYSHAIKAISPAKSFSLEFQQGTRWSLRCHLDDSGILPIPPPRRSAIIRNEDRPTRWGPPIAVSAVTTSTTSAIRHLHERRLEEDGQRERNHTSTDGICIPPPVLIEPPLTRAELSKDNSKCVSSTDETILYNIRRLVPNTFVIFELLDFDENIPGHYVSMLFMSMSKNKLDLKYDFTHVSNGFMVTYTIDDRFFMSWIAATKVAAKQIGAKKAIEMLRTLYPSIKTKHVANEMFTSDGELIGLKRKTITRAQLYEEQSSFSSRMAPTTNSINAPPKEELGLKLLKKMGWTGGGIGKDSQGIAEPIQIEDLQGRKGLGSNNLFPNQIFMRNLRRVLEDFINTNMDDGELQFTSEFNSEERKSIHKEALRLHLTSNSIGREGERRIRITQKRNVGQLIDHLVSNGGETARYELKVQTKPKPLIPNLNRRQYAQTAPPPVFGRLAPDACDDDTL